MAAPSEPLLPVEADPPRRLRRILLVAGASAAVMALAATAILARRGGPPAPAAPAPAGEAPGPGSRVDRAARREGDGLPAEEGQARSLFERAEAFERREPGDYEQRMAHWREVMASFPTSSWARRADERYRAAAAALERVLEQDFERTRQAAQALSAAGHYQDAIDTVRQYRAEQARELLRRRADAEAAALENACRTAYNEAMTQAKNLAGRRQYPAAAALFEALAPGAIPEVAAKCQTAAAQLREAQAGYARHQEAVREEAARQAFRESAAPRILQLVRSRRYEEALGALGPAGASAAPAALKDDLARERAAVADASAFWESFLKAARARTGQEAFVLLADGRRLSGKITRVEADRIVLDGAEGPQEAPLEQLHPDVLVGWTLGRTLPAEEALSYLKAALFFFCDGRDELAKTYLETARELGAPADAAERVFRQGILRAAMSVRK